MLKGMLCLISGIFLALVIYFMSINSFPDSEIYKVFWIFGLSIFAGAHIGASVQHITVEFRKMLKKRPVD